MFDVQRLVLAWSNAQCQVAVKTALLSRASINVMCFAEEVPHRFHHQTRFAYPFLTHQKSVTAALKVPCEMIQLLGSPKEFLVLARIGNGRRLMYRAYRRNAKPDWLISRTQSHWVDPNLFFGA